ncbi:MAG: hypothetical protein JSU01_13420 [Bacteroidetes bacterium]|nr:hypothetical protein [Bacteroidota bacterium]
MADKTCLLITQKDFYSFHKLLKQVLEEKGFAVDVAHHEYPTGITGKIVGKLELPIGAFITSRYIEKYFLNNKKYDLILIIKGRGVSSKLIDRMKQNTDRIIGYNWDSFKFNGRPLKWYRNVSKYYTFDFGDAANYSLPVVELFSALTPVTEPKEIRYSVSAIFRNHSQRLEYLDNILNNIKAGPLFLYIYEMNVLTFILHFLRSPLLYLKYWKHVRFKPLSYDAYTEALKNSEITIDYAHPNQSGITMRCYEAISLGTKIITNNELIRKSQYFDDSNSFVFRLNGDTTRLIDFYEQCKAKPFAPNHRSIYDFIDDLLEEAQSCPDSNSA